MNEEHGLTRRDTLRLTRNAAALAVVAGAWQAGTCRPAAAVTATPRQCAAAPRAAAGGLTTTPYLVVPYFTGDRGARPLPPAIPFWACPGIHVNGAPYAGQPLPIGTPVTVDVQASNIGQASTSLMLHLYWASPTAAFTSKNVNLIGQVPAKLSTDNTKTLGPIIWTPRQGTPSHVCLLAELFAVQDGPQSPFDTAADRHYAQRNLQIQTTQPGSQAQFIVLMANAADAPALCRLVARPADPGIVPALAGILPPGTRLVPASAMTIGNTGGSELDLTLQPGDQRPVPAIVTMPSNAVRGTACVTELLQYRGDTLVGGFGAIVMPG
jgi:hypothetical protein